MIVHAIGRLCVLLMILVVNTGALWLTRRGGWAEFRAAAIALPLGFLPGRICIYVLWNMHLADADGSPSGAALVGHDFLVFQRGDSRWRNIDDVNLDADYGDLHWISHAEAMNQLSNHRVGADAGLVLVSHSEHQHSGTAQHDRQARMSALRQRRPGWQIKILDLIHRAGITFATEDSEIWSREIVREKGAKKAP